MAPPADAPPLPAPRLKRVLSQQDRDTPLSPVNSECEGDAFESPVNLGNLSSRPWSSLKRKPSEEAEREEERERATSLPNYVRTVCDPDPADPGSAEEQVPVEGAEPKTEP